MTDRLHIEISGALLEEETKFDILAAAQRHARALAAEMRGEYPGLELSVTVKSVRPGKGAKPAAPIVQAVTAAPEPLDIARSRAAE